MYHLSSAVPAIAFRLVRSKVYIEMAAVSGPCTPRWSSRGVSVWQMVNIGEVAQSVPPQMSEERGEGWEGGAEVGGKLTEKSKNTFF